MERKEFLKQALGLCGLAMIPAGVMESCSKQSTGGPTNVNFTLDLGNAADAALVNPGGALIANGVLVIQTATGVFHALSATCTHAGCQVGYNASAGIVACPCHGGTYSATTGAVTGGPPPAALATYQVTQSGNILTVKS
jgi:cytochrome b6-f complex iron-sulfur subunit